MLTRLTLLEAAALLRTRKVSPVELTQACLDRIQQLDSRLHAFLTLTADSALNQARAAEKEISAGRWRGPLHGIPIAIKDLIDTAGVRTTAASDLFRDRVPGEDAEVVLRLKSAGAVLLGKLNLHELAYGASAVIGAFGIARNPWAPDNTAGGSSSGSAVAVAAQLCFAAIGTDTAGSVRMPASFCGIVGLKPTYGLVSARGVLPLSWSLDHVGPMTRTVADAAVVLHAIAGYDPCDLGSGEFPAQDYESALQQPVSGLRIGVPRSFFFAGLDPGIDSAVQHALEILGTMGCEIREVEFPVDTDRTVQSAEAYAVYAQMMDECARKCHAQTLSRLQSGANITAAEYILKKRELDRMRREARKIFDSIEVLVTPTTPVPAPSLAELDPNQPQLRARELGLLRNTRPWNVLGLPAISLPCGFTQQGLPVGLQVIGPAGAEVRVLALAQAYEQAAGWHKRSPHLQMAVGS